jgi:hypothetical protein
MSQHFTWGDSAMAAPHDDRARPLQSAPCSLCGIVLPLGLMMPDGGRACADIRWYCKDTKSCTERWTARLSRAGHAAPASRDASAGAGGPRRGTMPDPVPVELLGGAHEEA